MRGLIWALVGLAVGCTPYNPIDDCTRDGIDCCEYDADCIDVYGDSYPYCTSPGLSSGVCSECVTSDECAAGLVCEADGNDLRICVQER